MNVFRLGLCAIASTLLANQVFAHDSDPRKRPPDYVSIEMERDKDFANLDPSLAARGVFTRSTRWPPSVSELRVCFLDGSKTARKFVAEAASAWNKASSGIKLNFGKRSNPRQCDNAFSHIRVSFKSPNGGYWSYVGQDSANYPDQSEASLNLEAMDQLTADQRANRIYSGIILHEFGHALGMQHEHQNPIANCDAELNWTKVYESFQDPPPPWPKQKVEHNMRTLFGDDVVAPSFDPKSIMLYSLDPNFFHKGKSSPCYHTRNDRLSKLDLATLAYMYPAEMALRRSEYEQRRASFKEMWDRHVGSSQSKAVETNYLKIYYGDGDQAK